MTRLEQARADYAEAHTRYVNSSWRMGPKWRAELVRLTSLIKQLEATTYG